MIKQTHVLEVFVGADIKLELLLTFNLYLRGQIILEKKADYG